MDEEIQFFKKRLNDLAERSYQTSSFTYTDFLTMEEQAVYLACERELSFAGGRLYGGAEDCERQILRFGKVSELGYDAGFPIVCIMIRPVQEKFADALTHRDYLGALMHLGIKREMLGDIILQERTAYLFCLEKTADFILGELNRIKHTSVHCERLDQMPASARPRLAEVNLIVSGVRLDAVIAGLYHLSRQQSQNLIKGKKVFINGRQTESGSSGLKEQDRISVRGYGKFIYQGIEKETKKGRLSIRISRYV